MMPTNVPLTPGNIGEIGPTTVLTIGLMKPPERTTPIVSLVDDESAVGNGILIPFLYVHTAYVPSSWTSRV
jgi:hypothetical protein